MYDLRQTETMQPLDLAVLIDFLWNKRQPLNPDGTLWIGQVPELAASLVSRCRKTAGCLTALLERHGADDLNDRQREVDFSGAFALIADTLQMTERVLQIAEELRS